MGQIPVGPQVSQVWSGHGAVLLANQDITNPVTVGTTPQVFPDAPNADPIPPLGSIAYGPGRRVLYAVAAAGTAALLAIDGGTSWAPSPADIALQLQALGLATEATLQAVHGTLGAPAQDLTVAGLTAGGTIAQEAQQLGIPPGVPALASKALTRQGVSVNSFLTFPNNGRLWGVRLAYSVQSDSTGPGGPTQFIAKVSSGSGLDLGLVELGLTAANQVDSDGDRGSFNGLPISAGDTIILNVNNGVAVTHCFQRGSALALYSVP